MHLRYDDILRRIDDPPIWWSKGVPRFDPFRPGDVSFYGGQAALIHTECQNCRKRFDVAVGYGPYYRDLRNLIAYGNEVGVGDPPNGCELSCGAGASMGSLEIAVVEFWERKDGQWTRDPRWERPLLGAHWDVPSDSQPRSVYRRINESDQAETFRRAVRESNFGRTVSILNSFGCERPREVAHMLDVGERHRAFVNGIVSAREERFGKT